MNRCIIITAFINGHIRDMAHISKDDYIICADGGYKLAKKEGIIPHLVIGDFDSFTESPELNIPTIIHPVEKDDTDTLLCIKYAAEREFSEICLVGGMGGRLDHTISNLQSMAWCIDFWHSNHIKNKKISMHDSQNEVIIIMNGSAKIAGRPGEKISLISYSDNCINVTTKKLKWELTNAHLTSSFALGISNEFLTSECEISVESGKLLVIRSID